MSEIVSINFNDLETISKSCKNRGQLAELLDDIKRDIKDLEFQFSLAGNALNGGSGSDTQKAFADVLDDIDHDVRGVENNIKDFGKNIEKYLTHMDGILEVPNQAKNVEVNKDIEDMKKDAEKISDDSQGAITRLNRNITPPQRSFIIPPDEKSDYENRYNLAEDKYQTINDTVSDIFTTLATFDEEMDLVKDDIKKLGKFVDKDDFKPDRIKNIASTVIIVGVSAACPVAGIAIIGVKSAAKEFHDGRTVAGSLAIGAEKSLFAYAGGKVFGFAGKKIQAVGKRASSSLAKTEIGQAICNSTSSITSKVTSGKATVSKATSKLTEKLSITSKSNGETIDVADATKKRNNKLLSDEKRNKLKNKYKEAIQTEITNKALEITGIEDQYNDTVVKSDLIQSAGGINGLNNLLDTSYTEAEFEAALDNILAEFGTGVIWG